MEKTVILSNRSFFKIKNTRKPIIITMPASVAVKLKAGIVEKFTGRNIFVTVSGIVGRFLINPDTLNECPLSKTAVLRR